MRQPVQLLDTIATALTRAGMFDIAHMGVFAITGSNSEAFLQRLSCNSVVKARSETMIYSMFLNDQGMILDDVMLGCLNKTLH